MVVHDVEVNPVGAGGQHVAHFFAQAGEVGGEDGRGDEVAGRGHAKQGGLRQRRMRLRVKPWLKGPVKGAHCRAATIVAHDKK